MWSVWLVFCDCGFHYVCPLMDKIKRLRGSFRMGESDWGGNWVLFWWAGPCSVNLSSNFLLMDGSVFSLCCLTWGQTMVEVMKIMATSFKRLLSTKGYSESRSVHTLLTQCPRPCSRPLPTYASPRDSWTLMGKSGSASCGVTSPFSWVRTSSC